MSLNIRPLDDRVVVEPLEAEEKTPGGILLPDTAREKPQRGRVLAVGPGKTTDDGKRVSMSVAVGDEVLYGRYAGNEVKLGDKEVNIMRESAILATVVKSPPSDGFPIRPLRPAMKRTDWKSVLRHEDIPGDVPRWQSNCSIPTRPARSSCRAPTSSPEPSASPSGRPGVTSSSTN